MVWEIVEDTNNFFFTVEDLSFHLNVRTKSSEYNLAIYSKALAKITGGRGTILSEYVDGNTVDDIKDKASELIEKFMGEWVIRKEQALHEAQEVSNKVKYLLSVYRHCK